MMNTYPRESVEFQAVAVALDGVAVTSGVTFAVVAAGSRPVTWATPTTIGDDIGVMVEALTPGVYTVWAKVVASPETPVIDLGDFAIS